ncbi:MAG TPA: cytochrome c oxidase subunit II [Usitatibacter sp.]|jgi:cytochrome c oxidase subunit 2|nr:cytochrome c oxidase subunit II [Usitatibacter sp.]
MQGLHDVLQPAGPAAAHIATLWWLTLAICGAVFIAILVAFLIALVRAPRADAATPPDLAPLGSAEPRTRLVVSIAVACSIVGLLVLLAGSIAADRALARMPEDDALHIQVTGHQWWWDVIYDDPQPSRRFQTANEIHIPVGRPVLLSLQSGDVIHSFWVPNLAGKKDLIPGHILTLRLQADKAGTYRGQCAEFCGLQHAFMGFEVIAESPQAFAAWSDAQREPAHAPSDPGTTRGHDLFLTGTCMMCHAIAGTPAGARAGPDLTHVASRKWLAAGAVPNDPEHLAAWIRDPGQFKPGAQMPPHAVPKDELDALVAYLETLR